MEGFPPTGALWQQPPSQVLTRGPCTQAPPGDWLTRTQRSQGVGTSGRAPGSPVGPLWHGQTPLCPHCAGLITAFDLGSGREGSGSDGSLCPGILVVRWWPEQQGAFWLRGPGSEGAPRRGDLGQPGQGTGTRQLGPWMGRTHPGPWGEGEGTADKGAPGRVSAHCPVQLQHELGGCVSTGGCARSQGSR